jgi:hypothetical protein
MKNAPSRHKDERGRTSRGTTLLQGVGLIPLPSGCGNGQRPGQAQAGDPGVHPTDSGATFGAADDRGSHPTPLADVAARAYSSPSSPFGESSFIRARFQK